MQDSNINWVGTIPIDWKFKRLKNTGNFKSGKDYKHLSEGDIPLFGSSETPFDFVNVAICNKKAVAVGRKGTIDKPFITPNKFWAVDTCLYNTVPNKSWKLEYVYYWMKIIPFRDIGSQTAVPSLTQTQVNNTFIAQPSISQQTAIANYLDLHTAKIDKEISLLEKKVEKIEEYKQALIYETVTKGLDKNVSMKDSGIEWIGMIPEHWEVKRLKDIYSYRNGYAFSDGDYSEDQNGNYLIKITHVTENGVKEDENSCIKLTDITKRFRIQDNSILFALSGATAGKTCFFDSSDKRYYLNQRVAQIKNRNGLDKYLFYLLNNKAFANLILNLRPQTAQPNIGKNDLDNSFIPFTKNFHEQAAITNYLNEHCLKVDNKKEFIKNKIELLKEYKQSLIYEAVTGKIKIDYSFYESSDFDESILQDITSYMAKQQRSVGEELVIENHDNLLSIKKHLQEKKYGIKN
jgi:type I restriction enzyme S subunit